ncbi:MAG: DUF5684 domain-containing protein [Clostridia bacterium]|nr:DUF5684 domain-containing protein [Clostridia bacterium]
MQYDPQATALMGLVAGIGLMGALIGLVVLVLCLIASWRIFNKAGEPGWKCLIPLYGSYVEYRFCWNTTMFWVMFALSAASGIFAGNGFGSLCSLAIAVLYCMFLYHLAKSFGKGIGFTIGLVLFPPIFLMILGFGEARYLGPVGNTFDL